MVEYTSEWLCQQIVDNAADAIIFGDKHGDRATVECRRRKNVRLSR
jgi:hypothetical protein